MKARRQTITFLHENDSDSNVVHVLTMRQGNVFDSVHGPGPRLTVVFGHVGYNHMGSSWRQFRDCMPCLMGIDNPFDDIVSPLDLGSGNWLWFVPAGVNNGMTDGDLIERLDAILDWARESCIRVVVTNGIRDVDHGNDKAANRASDDRRTAMLTKYLHRRQSADCIEVEVVSLNDAFVRYWAT